METVRRIVEWLAGSEEEPDNPERDVLFDIVTLEDAARVAMGGDWITPITGFPDRRCSG